MYNPYTASYDYISDLIRYFHAETIQDMQKILDKGNIKADVVDSEGNNAFFHIDNKEIAAIDFLVNQKVSLKQISNKAGQTPLFMTKNLDKLKKIVSFDVIDINKRDNSGLPFYMKNEMTDIIGSELTFFIERGLDINQIAQTGLGSLSQIDMTKKGNVDFVIKLLNNNYLKETIDDLVKTVIEEKKDRWYGLLCDDIKVDKLVENEKDIWQKIKIIHEKQLLNNMIQNVEKPNLLNRI